MKFPERNGVNLVTLQVPRYEVVYKKIETNIKHAKITGYINNYK